MQLPGQSQVQQQTITVSAWPNHWVRCCDGLQMNGRWEVRAGQERIQGLCHLEKQSLFKRVFQEGSLPGHLETAHRSDALLGHNAQPVCQGWWSSLERASTTWKVSPTKTFHDRGMDCTSCVFHRTELHLTTFEFDPSKHWLIWFFPYHFSIFSIYATPTKQRRKGSRTTPCIGSLRCSSEPVEFEIISNPSTHCSECPGIVKNSELKPKINLMHPYGAGNTWTTLLKVDDFYARDDISMTHMAWAKSGDRLQTWLPHLQKSWATRPKRYMICWFVFLQNAKPLWSQTEDEQNRMRYGNFMGLLFRSCFRQRTFCSMFGWTILTQEHPCGTDGSDKLLGVAMGLKATAH